MDKEMKERRTFLKDSILALSELSRVQQGDTPQQHRLIYLPALQHYSEGRLNRI